MDVHPPHEPVHTWAQFWIHLGTITVGLLIALGLEQGFEWMHRVHERHVLQRELHEEGERNEAALKMDFARVAALKDSLVAWHRGVDEAAAKGGGLSDPQGRNTTTGNVPLPSEAMWDSARGDRARGSAFGQADGGVFVSLPAGGAAEGPGERHGECGGGEAGAGAEISSGVLRTTGKDSAPDFSKMSVDDLKNYSAVLNREIAELDETAAMLHYFDAVNRAVLEGAESQEDIVRRVDEKRTEGGFVPTN